MMSSAGARALPWLRMFPPSITFEDVEANAVHTTTVTLTNADARIHGVKKFDVVVEEKCLSRELRALTLEYLQQ